MSASGDVIFATSNFTVQKIHRGRKEEAFPQATFDGASILFGKARNSVYNVSGTLLDSENFDWMRSWDTNWDTYLKGGVLARNLWRFYLLYKAKIIAGYLLKYQTIEDATVEPRVPFQFSILVINPEEDDVPLPKLEVLHDDAGELYTKYGGNIDSLASDLDALGLTNSASEYIPPAGTFFGEGEVEPQKEQ
jgi:hypothetical protein